MPDRSPSAILTVRCPDRKGIVASVTSFLADNDATIVEATQFNDPADNQFFMRLEFRADGERLPDPAGFGSRFASLANAFAMEWRLREASFRSRTLIAVSRFGHCLVDLVSRWKSGALPIDIVGIVSNHQDLRAFVEWNGLPFHYLPATPETKAAQELKFRTLITSLSIELVVLARYMQVLSPAFCADVSERCINIHHSFLPSFKGARPYQQAHARGVKIIGATAHHVTCDLDEGPIIEQAVERVGHNHSAADLIEIGRDIESDVLARAVRRHAESRVMVHGSRTVVFR